MTRLLAAAAALLALNAAPVLADYVQGRVIAYDRDARVITLNDRTRLTLDPKADDSAVQVGKTVRLYARMDENGVAPATRAQPAG